MEDALIGKLRRGIEFVRRNPQLIYTIFLIVVIPAAFILNGQIFLDSSVTAQERLEKEKIGILQDVFAEFTIPHMSDPGFLQNRIEDVTELNPSIESFQIYKRIDDTYQVIASSRIDEVGTLEMNQEVLEMFRMAREDNSYIFPYIYDDIRYWSAVRELRDTSRNVEGILFTNVSMEHIDALVAKKINTAYFFLVIIVLLVVILLVRHAKIVDYASLYRKLKEVDKMKDTFVSIAAHELRTPLTIIRGYTELLSESKLTKKDKETAEKIAHSAEELNFLVSDILDVARIQQGRLSMNMARVNPHGVFDAVTESLRVVAKEKGLKLRWNQTTYPDIAVDEQRFKQVLINIVGNAVKYTKEGHVEIKTRVDEESKQLEIRVSDTGIGISAEDQEKLFSRFYRVQSDETRAIRGTGLGLWISRRIIKQMGGSISVESIQGKGTDFIITIPLSA
jgi:signal transduction histidine kinase